MVKTTIAILFALALLLPGGASSVMLGTPSNPIYDKVISLREEFPSAVLTSWCRSREYNRRVGGVEGSRHIACMAVDIVVPDSEVRQLVLSAEALGFWVLVEKDHVHLEYR